MLENLYLSSSHGLGLIGVAIILLLGVVYLMICTSPKRPEYAVYGFSALWLLFPKYLQTLPVLGSLPGEGVRWFDLVSAVTGIALLVGILRFRPRDRRRRYGAVSNLLVVFTLMVLFSGLWAAVVGWESQLEAGIPPIILIRPYLYAIYTILFVVACIRSIDTFAKVEVLIGLMFLSGLELALEIIFLYYGNLVPFLRPWVLDSAGLGRFASLSFLSLDSVGLITIPNFCCAGYFLYSRRVRGRMFLMIFLAAPVFGTLAKTPLTAIIIAAMIGISLLNRHYRVEILSAGTVIVLVLFSTQTILISNFPNLMNEYLGGAIRNDTATYSSLQARLGLWIRSIDLFVASLPLGAGMGQVEMTMGGNAPMLFRNLLSGMVLERYLDCVGHVHITNSHNGFLETMVEHGILGGVFIVLLIVYTMKLLANYLKRIPIKGDEMERRIFLAQAAIYSALGGMAWRYLFEANDRYYHLILMFIFLLTLLQKLTLEHRKKLTGTGLGKAGGSRAGARLSS